MTLENLSNDQSKRRSVPPNAAEEGRERSRLSASSSSPLIQSQSKSIDECESALTMSDGQEEDSCSKSLVNISDDELLERSSMCSLSSLSISSLSSSNTNGRYKSKSMKRKKWKKDRKKGRVDSSSHFTVKNVKDNDKIDSDSNSDTDSDENGKGKKSVEREDCLLEAGMLSEERVVPKWERLTAEDLIDDYSSFSDDDADGQGNGTTDERGKEEI
ncbi:unnamed protein product, partial [Anisakis simplex]|uniref:Suppressor protein SRP40-like n=1 Tax=Anisakis simplex TaxID=6269 RepID=A0A0M3J6E3_ANISI